MTFSNTKIQYKKKLYNITTKLLHENYIKTRIIDFGSTKTI